MDSIMPGPTCRSSLIRFLKAVPYRHDSPVCPADSGSNFHGTVYTYNAATGAKGGAFVSDGTTLPKAYKISATEHYVWVQCSDYVNSGDVYAFDPANGKLQGKFDSKGLNPGKVIE